MCEARHDHTHTLASSFSSLCPPPPSAHVAAASSLLLPAPAHNICCSSSLSFAGKHSHIRVVYIERMHGMHFKTLVSLHCL